MSTIVCPRCGAENPADATHCEKCKINLKFALEYPDEVERIKKREQKPDKRKDELKNEKAGAFGALGAGLFFLIVSAININNFLNQAVDDLEGNWWIDYSDASSLLGPCFIPVILGLGIYMTIGGLIALVRLGFKP